MCNTKIVKSDGRREPLDVEKINKVVLESCKGVLGVSASEIISNSRLQFVDGMTSRRIQEILVRSAKDLISEETPNYATPAARLQMYDLRKKVYGRYTPYTFSELYLRNVEIGKYDGEILETYTQEDWDFFDSIIDHKRDKDFSLAAVGQLLDKYLVQNRKTEVYYETPQVMYMAIAITLLSYLKDPIYRRQQIKQFYDGASTFSFSLPTPIMAGVRTPTRQFSSCVLIKCGDSLPSINATAAAIVNYVSKKAGIGLDHSAVRGVGSPIRNGEMVHTGVLPFLKYHTAALKSCSQGGLRGGSATTYYPFWHYEFSNLIVLKNNKGLEENRERRMDYGLQLNGFFFKKYLNRENIYLFQPHEVPELYSKFYSADTEGFEKEYQCCIEAAKQGKLDFKIISSETMMDEFINERVETGRIYIAFVDNINKQSPFNSTTYPIYQSNLCAEIALPTKEFQSVEDTEGRIALCTLASMNMGKFVDILVDEKLREEFWRDCEVLIQALDGLLSYQDYPMVQARLSTEEFRTLGVGIVNLADFHAQLGVNYGDKLALEYVNRWMEMLSYGLTKASVELAKQEGPCGKVKDTCYGLGKFPWEYRNKNIDKLVSSKLYLDGMWEDLRKDVVQYGIRNATLMAVAPTESSAQVLNATNGMEMPKAKVTVKSSKSGNFKQVVPNPEMKYSLLWEQKSPEGYLDTAATMQKFLCQSASTNTFYVPTNYIGGKIPKQEIIRHIFRFYTLGGKTFYYNNVEDGSSGLDSQEEICETCVV